MFLSGRHLGWLLAMFGIAAVAAALLTNPGDARSAVAQNWSPFVLVSGLLLIGLVADEDRLFAAAGYRLAQTSRSGWALFLGAAVMIAVVTAILNLDTSVAFLTPVLVYTARSRGEPETALLYGCILLSNAGSLFLPGSNLTNLIVLGHLHIAGGQFFARMWLPALAALGSPPPSSRSSRGAHFASARILPSRPIPPRSLSAWSPSLRPPPSS
jgi:arsenical pump membrane protein